MMQASDRGHNRKTLGQNEAGDNRRAHTDALGKALAESKAGDEPQDGRNPSGELMRCVHGPNLLKRPARPAWCRCRRTGRRRPAY